MIDVPVRVKDALKSGYYKKEYLIHVYRNNTEIKTLDNTYLVNGSVKFDERMCSGKELKFGLCEGSSLEFQYFNYDSILGCRLYVEVSVQYKDSDNTLKWHSIPIGWFDVDSCSRQASTGIIKVTAYNKLKSGYLDQDAKPRIEEIVNQQAGDQASVLTIIQQLLTDYTITHETYTPKNWAIYQPTLITPTQGIRIKTVDGFDYNPPSPPEHGANSVIGKYFGVYYFQFYLVPSGTNSITTDKFYKYTINTTALWSAFSELLKNVSQDWDKTYPSSGLGIETFTNILACRQNIEQGVGGYFEPYEAARLAEIINDFSGEIDFYSALNDICISKYKSTQYTTEIFTGGFPCIRMPIFITCDSLTSADVSTETSAMLSQVNSVYSQVLASIQQSDLCDIYEVSMSTPLATTILSLDDLTDMNGSITLRDLQSAVYEVSCQYGKLDRVTDYFDGIELNNNSLYPADNLYPANSLYPAGSVEGGYPAMYSKLWADENNIRSFRYLIITYKTTETVSGQTKEVEKTLQRTVNASGTDDYNMSDNWLFRNLVWSAAQIGTYADAMVAKMRNIRWFPFEMWCAGLPYLEAGDQIEIWAADGIHPSYVLNRTMNGIQNLQDTMINGELDIF